MATTLSLSEEERSRVVRMTADVIDLIIAEASTRDGKPDEETNARLLERRKQTRDRLDVGLALDLADRLGEDVLPEAVEEYTPPSARASVDALMKLEGGMLPFVQNRIGRVDSIADTTIFKSDTGFGCLLGVIALVGGWAARLDRFGVPRFGGSPPRGRVVCEHR